MPRKSTRNAPGSGTIRQRKDGTWEARFTVGRDPGTGRQLQKSIYGKTRQEVAQKLRRATAELDAGTYMEPSRMTVGAWLDVWHREYLGSVKASTAAQYEYLLRVRIKPAIGAVKLSELTAPMIQHMYNDAVKNGLSPKSVRNLHGVLHKALDQAAALQYIRVNPCTACKLPRVEKHEIRPIEGEKVKAFLQAIKGTANEDLLFVDVFSGLRQAEIIGLTWDCVDFQRGIITVSKQLRKERIHGGGGTYKFTALKNDKTRVLMPAPEVFTVLRRVQLRQKENRLKAGSAWDNPMNLVFTNALGGHLCSDTVYGNFKRIAEKIGIPAARFHDLRHTFATLSLQNGDDIKTVSENLGHATTAFTLDVYGHVTEQMRKESATRMQAFIDQAKA